MAQIDKLLDHVALRGGAGLTLEPDQPPTLQMPDGQRLALLNNPVPATMIDLLAREIVPAHLAAAWTTRGEASFAHATSGETFRVVLSRSSLGVRIQATPLGRAGTAALVGATPAPAPSPAIALADPPAPHPSPAIALADAPAPHPSPAIALADPSAPHPSPSIALADPSRPPAQGPAGTPPEVRSGAAAGGHPLAEGLFRELLARNGSDLHCSSFEVPICRVHGDLEELDDAGLLGPSQLMEIMEALAPAAAWRRFQERHDVDFAYPYEAGGCRLRVNYFMDRVGPGFVCRVIPNQLPDPDQLGLELPIRRLAMLPKGLVLVTGPTGSGKSTTLAALIDLANQQRADHILTIEDPIEFVHPRKRCLVNQREVGTHTESFKSGLRAALREDPDIVLVGELRDLETIAIALETAVTGHLVFGTLHTSSAVGTVDRIVDQFPSDRQQQVRVMLADSLKCVISQILLKRIGGGRIAALESLFITPAISNLIREGKNFQIPSAMQTGRAYGQRLMNDALVDLISGGKVDVKDAYNKCPDKETFMDSLKRAGIGWDPRAMGG
jgi:twitching motility protein PilT